MTNSKRSIVILGATSSIGAALATSLAAKQQSVVLLGRDAEKLKVLSEQITMPYFVVEGTQIAAVDQCFQKITDQIGPVTQAVNCIGSILLKPAHLISEQDWLDALTVNLTSAFALVKAAARCMLKTGGSIVLVSAAAAEIGLPNHEAVGAAKAGVNGLMRAAAATYAANNIRVNCVAPGLIETHLTQRIMKSPASLAASLALHPLNRVGAIGDIVNAIAFLLANENNWLTGQVLTVDGGLSALKTFAKA